MSVSPMPSMATYSPDSREDIVFDVDGDLPPRSQDLPCSAVYAATRLRRPVLLLSTPPAILRRQPLFQRSREPGSGAVEDEAWGRRRVRPAESFADSQAVRYKPPEGPSTADAVPTQGSSAGHAGRDGRRATPDGRPGACAVHRACCPYDTDRRRTSCCPFPSRFCMHPRL